MANSSQFIQPLYQPGSSIPRNEDQVRFKDKINHIEELGRSILTIKRKQAEKQKSYTNTPKQLQRRSRNTESPARTKTKREKHLESIERLKSLAKTIKQSTWTFERTPKKRVSISQQSNYSDKQRTPASLKQEEPPTNIPTPGSPIRSFIGIQNIGIPQLASNSNKIHMISVREKDVEIQSLKEQISRKQQQVDLIKKKYASQKQLLIEEIQTLDESNKDYEKVNRQLKTAVKNFQTTILRLQRQLNFYKGQLPRQTNSTVISKPPEPHSDRNKINRQALGDCECPQLRRDVRKIEHRLRKAQRMSLQYQQIICDLHLTNQMYKQQLDVCGQSKKSQFLEAQKKLRQAQTNRKKM